MFLILVLLICSNCESYKLQLNGWWLIWLFFFCWIAESSKYMLHHCAGVYLTRLLDAPWLQFCRMQIWRRLNLVWQKWILSRSCDETCQFPLLRVFRWMEKVLGPANAISLLNMMWGWKAIFPRGWNLPGGHIITGVGSIDGIYPFSITTK